MGKKFGTYSQEAVEAALDAIRNKNCPVRIAAETHGVPRETLRRRLKGLPTRAESKRDMLKVPPHLEYRLLAWLRALSVIGTHISHATFTAIVLELLKIEMDTENVYIGQTWFGRFLKRHGCAGLISFRAFRSDLIRDRFSERENIVWTMELLQKLGFCSAMSNQNQPEQGHTEDQGREPEPTWTVETFPKPENVWCLTDIAFGSTGEVLVGGDQCREHGSSVGNVWLRALECVNANGVATKPTLIRAQLPQHQSAATLTNGDSSSDDTMTSAIWSQETENIQRHGWQYIKDDLHSPALSQQTAFNWFTRAFLPMACPLPASGLSKDGKDNDNLKFLLVHGMHDAFLSAPIQQLCGVHNLHIVYLPAHTSECFQLCDLFASLCVAFPPSPTTDNSATTNATDLAKPVSVSMEEHVLDVYSRFRSAMFYQNSAAICDVWRKSGIVPFNPNAVLFPNELANFSISSKVKINNTGKNSDVTAIDTASVVVVIPGSNADNLQKQTTEQLSLPTLPANDSTDEKMSAEQLVSVPKTANDLYKIMSNIQDDALLSDTFKRRRAMYIYKKLFAKMDMLEQKATSLEKENEILKLGSQHGRSPGL